MRSKRALLGSVVMLAATLVGSTGFAADHTDSPRTSADQAADINDVYVFRGTSDDLVGAINGNDRLTTVLVMTVFPIADANSRFSDKVSYQFHINTGTANLSINCTATTPDGDNNQNITCAAGTVGGGAFASDTVAINAVAPGNPGNESMRIFAGLRDDPFFFFDLLAFRSVLDSVFAGAPDPTPLVDANGEDFFEPLNTLSIVVEIDNSFFQGSDRVRVWGSTQRLMPE